MYNDKSKSQHPFYYNHPYTLTIDFSLIQHDQKIFLFDSNYILFGIILHIDNINYDLA